MTDPTTRLAEAESAKAAYERFVGPAIGVIREDYTKKLASIAVQPMEGRVLAGVQNLSLALRVLNEVEGQLRALIADAAVARADMDRAGAIARMSPEARRYAEY
jgi:hypothetical protein